MTLIASTYVSKAGLREALHTNRLTLHEPSIMGSWTKRPNDLPVGFSDVVTNSERTKFAKITRTADGWKVE
jgi:hypothetical protein